MLSGEPLWDLIVDALRQDAARPLITFYDDATGERAELSVATYANWVAKTANFLRDGLGAVPGERVALRLPPHWQSAVWLSACWALGAVAAPHPAGAATAASTGAPAAAAGDADLPGARESAATRAALAVIAADDDQPPPPGDELVVLGLGPLGLPRPHGSGGAWAHDGALDYDSEIHSFGDHFGPSHRTTDTRQPALDVAGASYTAAELLERAAAAVASWQLQPGDRILCASRLDTLAAVVATVLVPLAGGVGAVLCRHLDLDRLPDRVAAEQVVGMLPVPGPEQSSLPDLVRW